MRQGTIRPTLEDVEAIIDLDANPILRNLRITQGYYDLSQAMAVVVGEDHLNWCTFATWASKAAGRFIRLRVLTEEMRRLRTEASGIRGWLLDLVDKKLAVLDLRHASFRDFIDAVAVETSRHITQGNLRVFAELGPLFAALVHSFGTDAAFDAEKLQRFLDRLQPGTTDEGGQDSLRDAVRHFYHARFEADPKRKAEHLLAANALTGIHEQIQLQEAITGGVNAPVAESLRALCREVVATLPGGFVNTLHKIALTLLRPLLVNEVQRRWQEVVTEHLMTLPLPDGTLRLGRDVPVRPGQPPFPPLLLTIDDAVLYALLDRYGAADASLRGSRANNWTDLAERMGYIFELFRARQQDAGLFAEPFTPLQRQAIAEGRVPDDDL